VRWFRFAMWIAGLVALVSLVWAQQVGLAGPASAGSGDTPGRATIPAGDVSLVMWQPSESYEGHTQADARLDKPVQLWRAGMPLREVLAEATRQTGVSFDFWPPQAEDARLCVTLYLNPQQPPSLRAVMAQLSWVTGCGFAYPEGQAEARAYYLLGTSLGQGLAERMAVESQARREQFGGQWQERRDAERKAAGAALQESKRALGLSREELIARYRGVNDALLLNMLDPPRRAAVGLIAGLPEADVNQLLSGRPGMLSRPWSQWSADQQAALREALGLEQRLAEEDRLYVVIGSDGGGSIGAFVQSDRRPRSLGRMTGLLSSGVVRGDQEVALRRHLGEITTSEQEAALRNQQREARQADMAARREQWAQQRTQAIAEARSLSPSAESLLTSLSLPDAGLGSGLWQLQEAVAKASGLNVISDCFWPPRGEFPGRRGAARRPVSALDALTAACSAGGGGFGPPFGRGGGGFGLPSGRADIGDLGMEWGDAGAFLRFRSQNPELWRAAVLPPEVRAQLDSWLEPHLAAAASLPAATTPARAGRRAGAGERPGGSPLAGEIEKLSWLAGRLNDLQVRLGGATPYEDPSDPKAARLQAMRRATLEQVGMRLPFLRLMATFTPDQWTRVRTTGLRWGHDFTPDQQAALPSAMLARGVPEGRLQEIVVQIGQAEGRTIELRDGTQQIIPPAPALRFVLDGKVVNEIRFSGGRW